MANKKISIELRAKNAMAAGIASAEAALKSFGSSVVRIGKQLAMGFLAGATAVAGFAAKAIAAYSQQEAAERSLVGAMNAHGEAGKQLLPSLKSIAAAIQDETGAADEATLAGMARMRMLGVQTSKLGEAAKATIALKAVGMEEAAAQKAVAMAMQGNYDMLNRYVPALRNATSETQKAQIVNDLLATGYEQQKETLDTVAGRWGALKGRIGDAWEEIGAAIAQNDHLKAGLDRAGEAVKAFGKKVSEWVGGGVQRLIFGFRLFAAEAGHSFSRMGGWAKIAWASLADGAQTAWNYIKNLTGAAVGVTVAHFQYLGDYAVAIWNKIKAPRSTFDPPTLDKYKAALSEMVDAAMGKDAAVTARTVQAIEEMDAAQAAHNERISELMQEQVDAAAAAADAKVDAEVEAFALIESAAENHADKMAAIREAGLASMLSEIEELKEAEKDAAEEKKKAEEDASKARQRFLDRDFRKEEREKEKALAREEERIRRALEAGEKGMTGAHIDRAKAIMEARARAALEEEREYQARINREGTEAAAAELQKEISENTKKTAEQVESLNNNLVGG